MHVLRVSADALAPAPQSGAMPTRADTDRPADPASADWRSVGGGAVDPDSACVLNAGRYRILIEAGSVDSTTDFTVSAYDTTVLDVELGPHGKLFKKAVRLCVSYAGTASDPDSPDYDGSEPEAVWYNEASGKWVPLNGLVDPQQKTILVKLQHFSRYAIQKASW